MISKQTKLKVSDNSGALYVRCFAVKKVKYALPGDRIKVSVIKAAPNSKVQKGTVHEAVVLSTKSEYRRASGESIRFSYNTVALLKGDGSPLGTRITQVVPSHLQRAIKSISRGVC